MRQLSSTEIFEQAAIFSRELKQRQFHSQEATDNGKEKHGKDSRLSNIVFMGEGEPLMNFRNVMEAVARIRGDLDIGSRHITISTVGVAPRIRSLAEPDMPQVQLAVSLHAATNTERLAMVSNWLSGSIIVYFRNAAHNHFVFYFVLLDRRILI